ncbi:hypothetical protein [Scytonema sp. NUACC21]
MRASTLFSEVVKGAVGDGGNVEVTTGSLFATNGGRLEASTEGQGNAGNVIVKARDIVRFDGTSRDGRILSGALSNVVGNAVGTGGNVEITAGSLFVANGAQVDAFLVKTINLPLWERIQTPWMETIALILMPVVVFLLESSAHPIPVLSKTISASYHKSPLIQMH